jgi:choice-of-anchor A domain-containing protein
VEGAVLVGGNLSASSYSINQNNKDAYGTNGYALVVGGNLNYSAGSIKNGSYNWAATRPPAARVLMARRNRPLRLFRSHRPRPS